MDEGFAELLYRALSSKLGIVVHTSDPEFLRTKLYSVRKSLMDPELEVLSIKPSHSMPATELWIVRKTLNPTEPSDAA